MITMSSACREDPRDLTDPASAENGRSPAILDIPVDGLERGAVDGRLLR